MDERLLKRPTPGPWISEGDRVVTGDGRVICDVRHAGTHITGYNCNLLAAAPQLLAAARQALKALSTDPEEPSVEVAGMMMAEEMLRAAINAAAGKDAP